MAQRNEAAVMSVDEAARMLGISRNSAYDAVHAGEIPSIRIGRRIVVPRAPLRRMLMLDPPIPPTVARRAGARHESARSHACGIETLNGTRVCQQRVMGFRQDGSFIPWCVTHSMLIDRGEWGDGWTLDKVNALPLIFVRSMPVLDAVADA